MYPDGYSWRVHQLQSSKAFDDWIRAQRDQFTRPPVAQTGRRGPALRGRYVVEAPEFGQRRSNSCPA